MTELNGDGWRRRPRGRRRALAVVTGLAPRRAALVGAALVVLAGLALPAWAAAGTTWSPAATITGCPAASGPRVVFPSTDPHTSSGPGAILWTGDPATCGRGRGRAGPRVGAGEAGSGVGLATIGAGDLADLAQSLPLGPGPAVGIGPVAGTTATGDGRVVVVVGLGNGSTGTSGVLQGRSSARFGRPIRLEARTAPLATASSYLGDVAIAGVSQGGRVVLRLEPHGAPSLSRAFVLSARPAAVTAVAVGLDYRGDALVVWAHNGFIYRRVLRATGRLEPAERVAPSPPGPHLQALISDDNRGIIAWAADVRQGAGSRTRIYLDTSGPGVHFGRPRLVEDFRNPAGVDLPDGSIRLVRLAGEGVMMAWTGMSAGRYVVRAAPISLDGSRPATVVSRPSEDAILADLATGSRGEALAVWTAAPRQGRGLDMRRAKIEAARGVILAPGVARFAAPATVSGPAAIAPPRAGIDPATDVPVVVWQRLGAGIAYAARRPDPAAGRGGPFAGHGRGGWPAWIWGLAGVGVLVLVLVIAAGLARTRRSRRLSGMEGAGRPAAGT
ncbi:MAG: hypothetical protein LC720_05005 [Actinobacteria bacterium]|nr:hypothetical protein [Actinomycetota bacterium]